MKYKNKVTEYRKAIGKTQQQLANDVRVSVTHIQRIEYGENTPTVYLAKKISKSLNKNVDEVFPADEENAAASGNDADGGKRNLI